MNDSNLADEITQELSIDKTRVAIKVQDGCDAYCSYCIIPFARGPVRSREIKEVIDEVENIVENDVKEIVITGIQVSAYGKDFNVKGEKVGLIDLLEEINKVKGLKRIRLSSISPTIITEEFVKRLSKLDKICDHFHLSLQSGCDETLKRMNRKYTTKEYMNKVTLLRKYFKESAFTTDIIVGFPGETDEEFLKTVKFVDEVKFSKIHVFKYSPRKGTKAAQIKEQILAQTKEQRSSVLIEISKRLEEQFAKEQIGKVVEVLFEEIDDGYTKGHTTNYVVVKVKNNEDIENQIKQVRIIKNEKGILIGEI